MTHNSIIAALRKNYSSAELLEQDLEKNPIEQFKKWFKNALDSEITEPNAFCLSTVQNLEPQSRIVLLKSIHDNGFVFFTNYNSDKGQQITQNSNVAMNFVWLELERQVRINGIAEKISDKESDDYFYSRPIESQIGAIVSAQSSEIESREVLEKAMTSALEKYKTEQPKRPENWGGYLIKPHKIEFWQGRNSRLHDRICYEKINSEWLFKRLSP